MSKKQRDASEHVAGSEERIVLLYDCTLKRPGCVILQAAAGCGVSSTVMHDLGFDAESWLVHPTLHMRRISGTKEEWRMAAEMTRAEIARKKAAGESLR